MIICQSKMDKRGRITIPLGFLRANKIKDKSWVNIRPVAGREDAVKLEFELEVLDEK